MVFKFISLKHSTSRKLHLNHASISDDPVTLIEISTSEVNEIDSQDNLNKSYIPKNANAVKSLRLAGFIFPLRQSEDIDRLESMVKKDTFIRKQYVSETVPVRNNYQENYNSLPIFQILYASNRISGQRSIIETIQKIFSNESLLNYTYNGVKKRVTRKAMKNYDIFTDCLLSNLQFNRRIGRR